MIKLVTFFGLFVLISAPSFAQEKKVPQFRNYSVKSVYKGKNASVQIGEKERMFRTRLRAAAKEKPNFAGHYVVTSWGCGTTCLMGAIIDVKTGKVYWWDFSLCCWGNVDDGFNPIEIRKNSNLIIFSGTRNEGDGDYGSHFYKFENGKFEFLETVPRTDGMDY